MDNKAFAKLNKNKGYENIRFSREEADVLYEELDRVVMSLSISESEGIDTVNYKDLSREKYSIIEIIRKFYRECGYNSKNFTRCFWKTFCFDFHEEVEIIQKLNKIRQNYKEFYLPKNHKIVDSSEYNGCELEVHYKLDSNNELKVLFKVICSCQLPHYPFYTCSYRDIIDLYRKRENLQLKCYNQRCDKAFSIDPTFEFLELIYKFQVVRNTSFLRKERFFTSYTSDISNMDDDSIEPISTTKFLISVNCQNKILCKGVCKHVVNFHSFPIDKFIEKHSNLIMRKMKI